MPPFGWHFHFFRGIFISYSHAKVNICMKLLDLLLEGRADFAAQTFGTALIAQANSDNSFPRTASEPTALEIVNKLADADPTAKKSNIMWIAKMYSIKQFKFEDLSKIKNELVNFIKYKTKLVNHDLMSYKDLNALYDALEKVTGTEVDKSKRQIDQDTKMAGAEKIFKSKHLTAVHVKTQEAACFYGAGTKWCTAAEHDNAFESYKDDLIVIMASGVFGKDKNGKEIHRKFQLHYDTDSFMNERDQPVSTEDIHRLSELPEWKAFLNMLIDKHYGKYLSDIS